MFRLVFLAFFALLMAGGAEPASAQPGRAPDVQPLDQVLPQVRSRYPGTFYDADGPFMDERGSPHYRLKWMTPEGRVIWLDTDARTGRVLGVERGGERRGNRYSAPPRNAPPPDYYESRSRERYRDEGHARERYEDEAPGRNRGGNPYGGRDRWEHGGGDRGGHSWRGGHGGNGGYNGHGGGHGHHGG